MALKVKQPMSNKNRLLVFVLLTTAVLLGSYLLASSKTVQPKSVEISFDAFITEVEAGRVKSITVDGDGRRISGEDKDGKNFFTFKEYYHDLANDLKGRAVRVYFETQKNNPYENLWNTLIYVAVIGAVVIIFGLYFIKKVLAKHDLRSTMKAKISIYDPKDKKNRKTFVDVAGIDDAKEELAELVEFLKEPEKFICLGARIPKGVLLVGPPGTGKTLLARAVAAESGVPFLFISGSDFMELFVGVGASRVRQLFELARKKAPCIVFIDELDASGKERGSGIGGGHDEREQTLNQLLVEMDGFEQNSGIILMGATNRPDILDKALLRPGRFDRQVLVREPDLKGREQILLVHAKNKKIAANVDFGKIAVETYGMVGADLANVMNEAAIIAAKKGKKEIEEDDIERGVEKAYAGSESSKKLTPKEKKIIAYHEAGHAIVGLQQDRSLVCHRITITPRQNGALGFTALFPTEEKYLFSRNDLKHKIRMLFGGRAAEDLVFGDITTGASKDLKQATDIQRQMISRYGMDESFGPAVFEHGETHAFLGHKLAVLGNEPSQETLAAIDKGINLALRDNLEEARKILKRNRDILERLADALLEHETLGAEEVKRITGDLV